MLGLLLTLAAIGHVVLWVAIVNRLHAVAIPRMWIHVLTGVCGAALVVIPFAVAHVVYWEWHNLNAVIESAASIATAAYVVTCVLLCIASTLRWFQLRWHPERRDVVLTNHTTYNRPAKESPVPLAAAGVPTWLTNIPWNQALDICVQEKRLAIPRLGPEHDGLRIAHLSDLHMSGRITKAYFQKVVEHVNRCEPDLVAITGDLVERDQCLDWIPDTLGQLQAPGGRYYVLGNHDRNVDIKRLHQELDRAGLVHLGGRWRQVDVRGVPLIVAGNELPWFGPAADLSDCPMHATGGAPLRILLSHSPDQFEWAEQRQVDLMLAGHNHGGQVRLPVLGAILAPSLHGVRYAAGAYQHGHTVMHVSRGTSSMTPLRFLCPPEIAILTLCSATGSTGNSQIWRAEPPI
jgi:predicted MPP superfamily phosphohydrolase